MRESEKILDPVFPETADSTPAATKSMWAAGGAGRRMLVQALRVSIAAVLLWLVASRVDWAEFGRVMSNANPWWLFAALVASAVDRLWMAGKWHYLIRRFGVAVHFIQTLTVCYYGVLVGMAVQWGITGDVTRAVKLGSLTGQHKKIVISVVLEKLAGLTGGGVAAVGAAVLLNQLHPFAPPALVIGAAILVIVVFPFVPIAISSPLTAKLVKSVSSRISSKLDFDLTRLEADGSKLRKATTVFFFLTLGEQMMPVVILLLVQFGFGMDVTLLQTAAVIPIIIFLSRLPISVEGLGVYEGVTVLLFGLMGISAAEALAVAITSRVVGIASEIVGVGICLAVRKCWFRDLRVQATNP